MKKVSLILASLTITIPSYLLAYGAIAVDDEVGYKADEVGYYIATGESSKESAKKAALKGCKDIGNKNCEVVAWFETCGAYAVSKKYSGIGYGSTKEIAINMALDNCGDSSCRIVVAECE